MRGFGLFAVFALLVVVLIGGAIGYNVGVDAGVALSGAPVAYPAYGHGFPFFGLFFGLIFLFVIFAIIRRVVWGGHHGYDQGGYWMHGYGRHRFEQGKAPWGDKPVPPFADEMLQRWHQEAHGQPAPNETDKPAG